MSRHITSQYRNSHLSRGRRSNLHQPSTYPSSIARVLSNRSREYRRADIRQTHHPTVEELAFKPRQTIILLHKVERVHEQKEACDDVANPVQDVEEYRRQPRPGYLDADESS